MVRSSTYIFAYLILKIFSLLFLSLMASSSSSSSHVFPSFHRPDVRREILTYLGLRFGDKGISMFYDEGYDEGRQTIRPDLKQAIKESRISIVLLSENYASSRCCLDELVEILECKKYAGQIVIPVFYLVDPSDVWKQTGDFGIAFNETCAHGTEEERQRWSQALKDVVNLDGHHLRNRDNEAEMINNIFTDVLNILQATRFNYFKDMVGIDAHLEKVQSLLHLDDEDEAMIVGICGPAGIGKSTIARALLSRLSGSFQHTCFMENLGGIRCNDYLAKDEYYFKLQLQEKFIYKILNHNGTDLGHLGALNYERLRYKKVLFILDNVDDLQQLEALADETSWFGPGSRIIVTTQDPKLLRQHGIDVTYHVDLPSNEEALEILCRHAFKQSYPRSGFRELALRGTEFCGKLPLRLCEVGLHLRGKNEEEWEKVLGGGKSNNRCSTGMALLVVINLLLEITSSVADQLSSVRKAYFSRISLVMSILSVVLSILDLTYKIRAHRARFRCRWMRIPWFYYPARNYSRIFGSFADNALLFCVVGQLVVSTINCSFIERRLDGPIKVSVWPLFFAIGMVFSKFMEKRAIYKEN